MYRVHSLVDQIETYVSAHNRADHLLYVPYSPPTSFAAPHPKIFQPQSLNAHSKRMRNVSVSFPPLSPSLSPSISIVALSSSAAVPFSHVSVLTCSLDAAASAFVCHAGVMCVPINLADVHVRAHLQVSRV